MTGPLMEKTSISMPAELLAQIRDVVGPRGVSGFLAEAAAHQLRLRNLNAYLEEHQAEHGAFTEAELADVLERTVYVPEP